jgi:hypothetical protein
VGNVSSVTNTTTVTITGTTLAADDCIVNNDIYFTSGDASGQGGTITDYNGTTKVVTFTPAVTTPTAESGYSIGPKIVIIGDGQGANVRCTVNAAGAINATAVISGGNNYSNATITVLANASQANSYNPSPTAVLTPIIGPAGGHGSDSIKELGGFFIIVNSRLEYSESNTFTTANDFRKVGLLAQPKFSNGDYANTSVVDQATSAVVSSWNGTTFSVDELVTGATSGATGRVVDFTGNNTIRMTDVVPAGNSTTAGFNGVYGYFTNTEVLVANTIGNGGSGASATANGTGAVTGGDLQRYSGDIIYIENRSPISRADDQIEDIKLIIEF